MQSDFAQVHKLNAFARFKCYPEMLLFSELRDPPEWAISDSLDHFAHRFPTFVIAFFCKGRLWARTWRKDTLVPSKKVFANANEAIRWLRTALAEQFDERIDVDNDEAEQAYGVFYKSQYISSRRNLKMQKKLMPSFFYERGTP